MAYEYTKQVWVDYPNTSTLVTAEKLNHIEDGIYKSAQVASSVETQIEAIETQIGGFASKDYVDNAIAESIGDVLGGES